MFKSRKKLLAENKKLEEDLAEAKNLRKLLEEVVTRTGIPAAPLKDGVYLDGNLKWVDCAEINLPEDKYPVYVDDLILGGKVIKQEATRAISISKEGVVTEGFTQLKPGKKRNYYLEETK
jgi:hypothetical protein